MIIKGNQTSNYLDSTYWNDKDWRDKDVKWSDKGVNQAMVVILNTTSHESNLRSCIGTQSYQNGKSTKEESNSTKLGT